MFSKICSCGLAAFAVLAVFVGNSGQAQAQSTSGVFGSSGPMSGSAGLGTASSSGLGSSGTSAFPTSQFPTSQFGASTGQTGLGQTGMGQTGMGATGMGATGQGQTGQRTGLVGQSNPVIAGMNQAGQTGAGQNMQGNRQGQGQNRNNSNRRQGQNQNQSQTGQGAQNQRAIRPQLIVAFDRPAPVATKMATTLATRFDKLSNRAGFENVSVNIDGNKVILRGDVASDAISRKAAMLAKLEPGVKSVQNELIVKAPAPAATEE